MRVLIAGGGLGGLTLAHGLRQAGLRPLVFERGQAQLDLSASYRIHVDAEGSQALHSCLPADSWLALQGHSAAPPLGIAFTTERLHQLAFIPDVDPVREPVAHAHPISRSGLRQLLLRGLEDVVRFKARVEGYELVSNDRVVARLSDGTSVEGDVLVGADGSASAIRQQLLPHARVVDSGVGGIAGKVLLNDRARQLIGEKLLTQMTMVLPVRGMAMFLAGFLRQPDQPSQLDLPEHLFWVVIGRADAFGGGLHARQHSASDLYRLALDHARRWHPLLSQLIKESDPVSLTAVPLHTSEPVDAWATTRVTLLGDAIHTMTPLQGLGGNTALRDAAALSRKLIEASEGHADVLSAVNQYEVSMRQYAFDAVRRSLMVSNSVASDSIVGRVAFRSVLQLTDHLPWLRQRMFHRAAAA